MNQIATLLTEAGINPSIFHNVQITTSKGKTIHRTVTPLGHNIESMVSRLDKALIANKESINDILDFTGDQPQVYLRRVTAPNRKSEINTETLLNSWTVHLNWLAGAKSHKNSFIEQFVSCFGKDKRDTATKIQSIVKEFKTKIWNPEHRKYVNDLRQAILATTETITDETVKVESTAVEVSICQGITKAGTPCKAKPVNGLNYCKQHAPKIA